MVYDAQGTQRKSGLTYQWHARIENNMWVICNQWIIMKTLVLSGILNNENILWCINGMCTKGIFLRGLGGIQTVMGFKPLALIINKTNKGNWGTAYFRSNLGYIVIIGFGQGIKDRIGFQFFYSNLFVLGNFRFFQGFIFLSIARLKYHVFGNTI